MPTKRRRASHAGARVGYAEAIHLLHGDCLFFCDLGDRVVRRGPGDPVCRIRVEQARQVWAANGDWLREWWNTKPAYNYAGRPADMPGPYPWGWLGLPSFAEALFDGAVLPKRADKRWPEEARRAYSFINYAVDYYTHQPETQDGRCGR